MPVTFQPYLQFKGFAVGAEDVSLNDGDSIEVQVVDSQGRVNTATFRKRRLTVRIRGILYSQALPFLQQAENSALALVFGSQPREDIQALGITIRQATLISATATQPVQVGTSLLCDALELIYESGQYT